MRSIVPAASLQVTVMLAAAALSQIAPPSAAADLERVVAAYLEEHPECVGISVAVETGGGRLRLQATAGSAEKSGETPLRPEHAVRIASNTKTYTAASILRLAAERRLSLDDPIRAHLPADTVAVLARGGYDPGAIQVRHLLTHTSGLREHVGEAFLAALRENPARHWPAEEQIRLAVAAGHPLGPPGATFCYSDSGYVLLGRILERRTGLPLAKAVPQLLSFARIGVSETVFEDPSSPSLWPRAHQYWGELDTHAWNPSFDLYGGGGLVATPRDMARFLRALLTGEVLDPEAVALMRSLRLAENQGAFGAGLFSIDVEGLEGWGHTGFWNTFAFYFPAVDTAIAGAFLQREAPRSPELIARILRDLGLLAPRAAGGEGRGRSR